MVESGHIKAIASKTYGEVASIQDFFDYPTETVSEEMPLNISIVSSPANTNDPIDDEMKRFLTPGKLTIAYDRWTSRRSFMSMMRDLLQQTAQSRAPSTILED